MRQHIPIFQHDEQGLKIQLFQKEGMPYIAGRFKIPLKIYQINHKQPHRLLVLVVQCGSYAFSETLFPDIVSFEEDILIKDDFAIGVFTFSLFSYVEHYQGDYYIHMSIDHFISPCIEFDAKPRLSA